MNQFIKFVVLFVCLVAGLGCSKQMSAKSAARLDLSNAEMDECKQQGIRDENGCKEYQGAKMRKMAEFGVPPELQQAAPPAPAPQPPIASAPPPPFFPPPGAAPQQPSTVSPPAFPFPQGMAPAAVPMRGHGGYMSSRIVPPCVDGRGGAVNTDRMLIIDNSRVRNYFVTIEPLTAFEPCWRDRVDPVVIPIGGRMVQTFAVPEGAATTMMATIPLGCLNGSRGPSECPMAPRLIVKAWRDLGPGLTPEYIGKWDATAAVSGKLGYGPAATRLILAEHVFQH